MLETKNIPQSVPYILSIVLGMFTGYLSLIQEAVYTTALFIVVFGFILGTTGTTSAWRWAVLVGMFIPFAYFLALVLDFEPVSISYARAEGRVLGFGYLDVLKSLLIFGPAFLGVYLGVLANYVYKKTRKD